MVCKCILVIDDEADILEIAKVSLEITKGWNVLTAGSGEEGIQIAVQAQPDAILLDRMMPGVDGLETLKRLQANPATQNIPVILLTAARATAQRTYTEAGARAMLTKPFDPSKLAGQIEAILGWA